MRKPEMQGLLVVLKYTFNKSTEFSIVYCTKPEKSCFLRRNIMHRLFK